jgi:hypothetical protein
MPTASGMPGMNMGSAEPMPSGNGLASTRDGYTLKLASTTLGTAGLRFTITDSTGKPVTAFELDQTKLMHFYLVRSDLSGYQHVHPVMAADGTWTAPLTPAAPGTYRAYATFIVKGGTGKPTALVLSAMVNVPGTATTTVLPAPSTTTTVDGYTLTVGGTLMAGMPMPLKISVSKAGHPVTDLQPYLETYAHLTAIHTGDLAFAHIHPQGPAATTNTGGPDLTFEPMLTQSGDYRFFLQFQTADTLHTAAITLRAS